jgi:hypothetical protein
MDSSEEQMGGAKPPRGSMPAGEGALARARRRMGGGPPPPPGGEEEEGMLRMSFLEHLEELRKRIISALVGAARSPAHYGTSSSNPP